MKNNDIFNQLEKVSSSLVGSVQLNKFVSYGDVASALITKDGNIYSGVNIDTACSLGFCAEHSAIAEMIKNNENEIYAIVAVNEKHIPIPPCGRCLEFISQLSKNNKNTLIKINKDTVLQLKEILPYDWKDTKKEP